jgi:hypothetical protein
LRRACGRGAEEEVEEHLVRVARVIGEDALARRGRRRLRGQRRTRRALPFEPRNYALLEGDHFVE